MNSGRTPSPAGGTVADLAIVGAGAAGLFAAVRAVRRRLRCVVFERKARIGSKLLMTANGRCNFTRDVSAERMLADLGEPTASFAAPALRACPPSSVAEFFRSRGLRIRRMTDGRLFPASEKAADVVHVFGDFLRDHSVPLVTNCPVADLRPDGRGWTVVANGFSVRALRVLVATGGMSFPKTGSVGDAFAFARRLGIRTVEPKAGLTGFSVREREILSMAGRRIERGASAAVFGADGREIVRCGGEVEFEPWGVSGAAVYNCQRHLARHGEPPGDWTLRLDCPGGAFTARRPAARPLKESIVTVGGVALDEVDPLTMASKRFPTLAFAGEALDIDGPTGGYNLTLAFATAALAVSR